ncbi:DivIVA domain-containing protein [uncultured Megasphaera sp.]|uniref:DivIVA domain-containing protein n=2 Tax=uncultured Megasphaera sp. TaxID=165188 RepID=UPI0025D42737|nr:DivIVA domain-containing protein [uncultured Megasphaera sp.]
MLTPMDIHNKEFKRGFRGYSEEDVDAFMNNIAGDYEKVYREYCELKERCDSLQDKLTQYEKMEATMNSTLMLAQQTAENVKVSARKEAELILQEAESKKQKMLDETMMSLQNSQQEWEKLKAQTGAYRAKCRAILTSQLRLLDDMAADGEEKTADVLSQVDAAPAVSVNEKSAQQARPDQGRKQGSKDADKAK